MTGTCCHHPKLPPWFRRRLPRGDALRATGWTVSASGVATVCQSAKCPNRWRCWDSGHATFMILGEICTRACGFCAVGHGRPRPPDPSEPQRLAEAVAAMGVNYAVITCVTRDDLPDEGAGHFVRCIQAVRQRVPGVRIEALPADMHARDDLIELLCQAGVVVYNHNLETVRPLTPQVRPAADYDRSLRVLSVVRRVAPWILRKSGIMIGLGEDYDQIVQTMHDLLESGCQLLTVGQYLRPGPDNLPVRRYWHPDEFAAITEEALRMGFLAVASGPLVRSSYRASDLYAEAMRRASRAE